LGVGITLGAGAIRCKESSSRRMAVAICVARTAVVGFRTYFCFVRGSDSVDSWQRVGVPAQSSVEFLSRPC